MAELLLELFSEEIPARMQAQAAKDLERLVVGALSDRGLLFEGSKAFAGPRRLTLVLAGLPVKQPDVSEEKKGPRVTAPEKAIEGFLRSAGVTLAECEKRDDGKGEFYVAVIARKGRETASVLAEVLPECFAKLPWPKSMRWIPGEPVRWVRPLHSILCVFDGAVVPFEFAGVKSGATTRGNRFLSAGEIKVSSFEMYRHDLQHHHVMLDAEERKETILNQAKTKAFALGLELIEDEGLLNEVAGLNEWPTVYIGTIEDQFMDVPAEILQTSMRVHQKYFSLRSPRPSRRFAPQGEENGSPHPEEAPGALAKGAVSKDEGGKMAARFAVVSNMTPEDCGKAIVAGNERVLRARLSDAKFFWDEDRKHRLDSRVDALKGITFHAKLGTQYERVERIVALAGEIAAKIGADVEKAKRAALLCKADLTTGVVGEFPELQGIMGSYYAAHDGEDSEVVAAIREHYKPLGPTDAVPTSKVSIAVALADKLDQLVGFFAVGEKPTGSGDPFALRRAALGLLRITLDNNVRMHLGEVIQALYCFALWQHEIDLRETFMQKWGYEADAIQSVINLFNNGYWQLPFIRSGILSEFEALRKAIDGDVEVSDETVDGLIDKAELLAQQIDYLQDAEELKAEFVFSRFKEWFGRLQWLEPCCMQLADSVLLFLADRLKVALKENGTRHDLIDAVFSLGNEDDLVRLVARVEALQSFLKTDEGANLLAGYKRAANILKAEEKKDKATFAGEPDKSKLVLAEEIALAGALDAAAAKVQAEIAAERFVEAMGVMASLRGPVDAFFEKVRVNDDAPALRKARLELLARLRATLHLAADFSKIEG